MQFQGLDPQEHVGKTINVDFDLFWMKISHITGDSQILLQSIRQNTLFYHVGNQYKSCGIV